MNENKRKALFDIIEEIKDYVNETVHADCEYYIYDTLMDYIYDLEKEIEKGEEENV